METVLISALNQFAFCPRRCALIHVEGIFEENVHTITGSMSHEQTDKVGIELTKETGIKTLRALLLFSKQYGLSGKADVVEMHDNIPIPVEYKKGRRKQWDNDDVQLCAQALCLEEMFHCNIPKGYIYHITSKRRREVVLDDAIRNKTVETISAVRQMLHTKQIPVAVLLPRCDGCSLRAVCMPEMALSESARMIAYKKRLWERDV